MTPLQISGLAAVALLAALEIWYFLGPRRNSRATRKVPEAQEVRVLVKGGYQPDTVVVDAHRPVRLMFYRDESTECSSTVVFESLDIERHLPPYETTTVTFTPEAAGEVRFRCGMSTLRGRVVVREPFKGDRFELKGHQAHG